jgi:hypothetical protein
MTAGTNINASLWLELMMASTEEWNTKRSGSRLATVRPESYDGRSWLFRARPTCLLGPAFVRIRAPEHAAHSQSAEVCQTVVASSL